MKRIVLTGGPCGGKTTAQSYLHEKLSDFGWTPTFVPEVATMIIGSGLNPAKLTESQILAFEELMFDTQMHFEDDTFQRVAEIKGGEKPVLFFDRGLMDIKSYIPEEMFEAILASRKMTEVEARDLRYDAVLHLVTAAEGKAEFYTKDNNPARQETPEQAVAADLRTRNAWIGHSHLRVIDNSTLFDAKLKRLLNEVRKVLGIPVAIETEEKFLVHGGVQLRRIPVPFKKIFIEQVYLDSKDDGETRIRRRSQEDADSVFYETHKLPTGSAASRVETERQISSVEYAHKLRYARLDCDIIRKDRVCFLWENQYFELDIIREPKRHLALTLLEIELTEENDKVGIPPWLGKVEKVTGDTKYSNFALAKR